MGATAGLVGESVCNECELNGGGGMIKKRGGGKQRKGEGRISRCL